MHLVDWFLPISVYLIVVEFLIKFAPVDWALALVGILICVLFLVWCWSKRRHIFH
jgi:hypothetical protein